jgi:hypothetical protein
MLGISFADIFPSRVGRAIVSILFLSKKVHKVSMVHTSPPINAYETNTIKGPIEFSPHVLFELFDHGFTWTETERKKVAPGDNRLSDLR